MKNNSIYDSTTTTKIDTNNGVATAMRNGHDKTAQGENVIWIRCLIG